ncbi:hypothetical protein H4K35_09375 [Myroides sp. NP-2]|uniref:hypothetical protein n=1 Tax=Myroides sp. NP-2 TaxID=2759945 RepID=UPI0015F962FF|nr:hypothetical protein [Myroides sp. NP-2]MBB1150330.1 hypothetical protein [Myroides sp. NP-2]
MLQSLIALFTWNSPKFSTAYRSGSHSIGDTNAKRKETNRLSVVTSKKKGEEISKSIEDLE